VGGELQNRSKFGATRGLKEGDNLPLESIIGRE